MMALRHPHFPRDRIPLSETIEAWILLMSIVFAVWIIKSDLIATVVAHTSQFRLVGSFVEGFFFTSMLTTVPSIVAILESASYVPAWELALVGAAGAVCGDLLLFRFVRSRLIEHILRAAFSPRVMRFGRMVALSPLWWISPILGAVVISSPLPDELGLLLMGWSHIRFAQFIPLAFAANAAGIYLMASAMQRLS
ncbi:MAG: hypothetical protein RLZZ416_649 [Candidatus Parcubacteria bacterium]|jgi:hypothetical protein